MTNAFRKVRPGEPVRPYASVHNEMLDVIQWARGLRNSNGASALGKLRDVATVEVRNDSGSNLAAFSIVALTTPVVTNAQDLDRFKFRPALAGDEPTDADWGKFAVCLEPAPTGAVRRAAVTGLVPVQLDVGHASHTYADVKDADATQLKTGFFGNARIVWKESGTGTKWGLVMLRDAFHGPLLVKTDAAINADAAGDCSVYMGDPGAENDTGATLTDVYNRFSNLATDKWALAHATSDGKLYFAPAGGNGGIEFFWIASMPALLSGSATFTANLTSMLDGSTVTGATVGNPNGHGADAGFVGLALKDVALASGQSYVLVDVKHVALTIMLNSQTAGTAPITALTKTRRSLVVEGNGGSTQSDSNIVGVSPCST